MKFDPLDTAYQIAAERGIDTEAEQAAISGLGMLLMHHAHEQSKMYLSEMGDTYYRMPWQAAIEVIERQGFHIADAHDETTEYGTYKYLTAETLDKKIILTANASQDYRTKQWQLDHNMVVRAVVDTHGDHDAWMELMKLGASSHPLGAIDDETDYRFAMSWTVTDGLDMTMGALRELSVEFIEIPEDSEPLD